MLPKEYITFSKENFALLNEYIYPKQSITYNSNQRETKVHSYIPMYVHDGHHDF